MEASFGKYGYHILSLLQFMYPFLGKIKNYAFKITAHHIMCESHGPETHLYDLNVLFFIHLKELQQQQQ